MNANFESFLTALRDVLESAPATKRRALVAALMLCADTHGGFDVDDNADIVDVILSTHPIQL